jgi:WD40 repeat protein
LEEGTCLPPLRGHAGRIRAVAFCPTGPFIASGGADEKIRIWEIGKSEAKTLAGHTGEILSVAYSPDGRRIVTAAQDQTVRLWNAERGAQIGMLRQHAGRIRGATFSPDGRLAVASGDATGGEVRLIRPEELEERR